MQGCIGGAVLKSCTTTIQDPVIPDSKEGWPHQRQASDMTNTIVYSAAWLETHWGKPASITFAGTDHGDEIWTYKYDMMCKGIEPMILVPIPLVLPVGREKVRFVLRDGQVISAMRYESHAVGGAFGYSLGPCGLRFAGAYAINE